jgi:trimethylamine--corrinoid protein Co-methyltransferase
MTEIAPESTRRTRRDTARRGPSGSTIPQIAPGVAKRPFPPTKIVSDDQVEAIHHASLQILSEIGMDFLLPEARDLLKASGGVKIDGERVRFDPAFIEEMVSHAPGAVHLQCPQSRQELPHRWRPHGLRRRGSPPNCHDMDGGRRPGTRADFQKFLKLTQYFDCIDGSSGYSVEPIDLHPSIRHLEALRDKAILIDKPLKCYSLGRQNVLDAIEIARIVNNVTAEEMQHRPCLMTIVNTNSPLKLDGNMLMGMMELSSRGQIVCVTPFTLAGAMAPVTIAGAVALQNAEALAGLAFCQLVKKGAPVVYGGFTSNVDMKSGAPAFGTPEYMKSTLLGGQMARRIRCALPHLQHLRCQHGGRAGRL